MQRIPGLVFLLLLTLMFVVGSAPAHSRVVVQDITGHLQERDNALYTLSGLLRGDVLSVYVKGTSGNFDPMVILFRPGTDFEKIRELFLERVREALVEGEDPIAASRDLLDRFSLAWSDDLDGKYDARGPALQDTGGRQLRIAGKQEAPRIPDVFGSYRLLLGLNAPAVLTGRATPTGDRFASSTGSPLVSERG